MKREKRAPLLRPEIQSWQRFGLRGEGARAQFVGGFGIGNHAQTRLDQSGQMRQRQRQRREAVADLAERIGFQIADVFDIFLQCAHNPQRRAPRVLPQKLQKRGVALQTFALAPAQKQRNLVDANDEAVQPVFAQRIFQLREVLRARFGGVARRQIQILPRGLNFQFAPENPLQIEVARAVIIQSNRNNQSRLKLIQQRRKTPGKARRKLRAPRHRTAKPRRPTDDFCPRHKRR